MQIPCCLFGRSPQLCQPAAAWQCRQSGSLGGGLEWPCKIPAARHVAMHRKQAGACRSAQAVQKEQTGKLLLPAYPQPRRVMLKISGEALQGGMGFGVDPKVLQAISREVAAAVLKGVQVAIVVGGGNYFRGATAWQGLERSSADYVGMLATCMNALLLQSALEQVGVQTRVQTAIEMRVVIFGAGTGNPYFTTDTAAALRAAEIEADAFFKATKVDGVYDSDPAKNAEAKLHKRLSYREVMESGLQVMDETAITLCKENNIPVIVFNLFHPGNIMRALTGDKDVGTLVTVEEEDPAEGIKA